MNKKTSALIGALTLSAIILAVVLLSSINNRPAQASMLNAQNDFSLMTAGALGNDEALIIIDKGAQKMVVYNLTNGKNLNLLAGFNFNKAMIAPAAPKAP